MLFAIVVRLYSASTTRDYLFLTMMAFTSMLASAILTVDTVFLVFFFCFWRLAVSTFVGLEMWRSAQGAVTPPIETGTSAAQRLHNALGMTSAGIAFGSLAIGAVIFLLLPRFSGGYMSGFNLQPTLISGFSDDVELGEIGEIKKSSVVVMRIRVDGGLERGAGRALARRGADRIRRQALVQRAARTHDADAVRGTAGSTSSSGRNRTAKAAGMPIQYTVLLEPIATHGAVLCKRSGKRARTFQRRSRHDAVRPAPRLPVAGSDRLHLQSRTTIIRGWSMKRVRWCRRRLPPRCAQAGSDYPASMRETYLQLPTLDPRIPELAKQITRARQQSLRQGAGHREAICARTTDTRLT